MRRGQLNHPGRSSSRCGPPSLRVTSQVRRAERSARSVGKRRVPIPTNRYAKWLIGKPAVWAIRFSEVLVSIFCIRHGGNWAREPPETRRCPPRQTRSHFDSPADGGKHHETMRRTGSDLPL